MSHIFHLESSFQSKQSVIFIKKFLGNHSNCTSLPLTHGEMVRLDEGRFPALELNNRRLSGKNSFCRKNGIYTRYAIFLC